MFTVVNAVLLRPLPFTQPDRIVSLTERATKFPALSASWQNYADWRDQNHVFTSLALVGSSGALHFNIRGRPPRGPGDYILASYRAVSPAYLSTLGVPLKRGRLLDNRDREGTKSVVVINETLATEVLQRGPACGNRAARRVTRSSVRLPRFRRRSRWRTPSPGTPIEATPRPDRIA